MLHLIVSQKKKTKKVSSLRRDTASQIHTVCPTFGWLATLIMSVPRVISFGFTDFICERKKQTTICKRHQTVFDANKTNHR